MSVLLHSCEWWSVCSYMKTTWSNRNMIFEKQKGHIPNIRKGQLKFIWHIMRKVGLENLTLTSHIEDKVKTAYNLLILLESMFSRRGFRTDNKKMKFTNIYELWKTMFTHIGIQIKEEEWDFRYFIAYPLYKWLRNESMKVRRKN